MGGVSRERLYEEIWAEPMTTVAERYHISSNFLARVCERLRIPRPGRGYWAQRSAGLKVEQDPLPAADPGAEIEWVRDGSEPKRQPVVVSELIEQRPARAKGDKHPLVRGARAEFDHARETRDDQYVRPYKRNLVDVFVSKEMVDTALKAASDLFIALEEHGHRVMLAPGGAHFRHVDAEVCEGHKQQQTFYRGPGSWSPARPTVVLVRDTAFGLTLFEVSEEVEVR